jgi:3D (Asp-Asp-Asp) domain-containing protein
MSAPEVIQNRLFSKKIWKKIILSLLFLVIFDFVLYPAPVLASQIDEPIPNVNTDISPVAIVDEQIEPVIINSLPQSDDLKIVRTDFIAMSAYTSEIGQCDGNPCRTANGFDLCKNNTEDSVAANFLPFGTKIRIPDLFGERIFVVRDRMNARYDEKIDIWFKDRPAALRFGVKVAKVEILGEP